MRRGSRISAIIFIGLIFIHGGAAQSRPTSATFPELAPLPLAEQLSTMREPLPIETIVDAALEFSGASEPAAAAAKEKLVSLLLRLRQEVESINGQAELAERALTFLHKNLLTTYSVTQTRVDAALETGVYNCVSSAVLYLIAARAVGLSAGGVRSSDHAFCWVLVNGQPVDVETTNPFGYNPGSKKEFSDSFGKVTGYNYVPPSSYRDRRSIGEKELLGLILYNRVSEYGDAQAFREALPPAVSAYALVSNDETQKVMTIAFSNYISWLGMHQEFSRGAQFLDAVKATFGALPSLDQPRRDMYHNWVVNLIETNALAEADALLQQPAARTALEDADWSELSTAVVQQRAQAESATAGFAAAAAVAADGVRRLGKLPALLQAYEAYTHNAFAQLYNGRKLAEAKTLIEQGLLFYTESRILNQDLELVKKALKR
jgi:hypothetical protein